MIKSIEQIELSGKRVFIRVDFNVPLKNGVVKDDTRIKEALKTINYAKNAGGKVILASHLGRPKGEFNQEYSLKPVADYIKSTFFDVDFVEDCIGEKVKNKIDKMNNGDVLLLENLRFYKGEEKNLPDFVEELSSLVDVYINDAFGTCHRKHASVYGVPSSIEAKGAGFLIKKETDYFEKMLKNPEKPFAAILGGAKVSDKVGVISSLINIVDKIFIGGAMAYSFLHYNGVATGLSLIEKECMEVIENALKKASEKGVKIFLPIDHVASKEFNGAPEYVGSVEIPDNLMGLDIGEKTIELFSKELSDCKTILWNGPMGVFENENYAKGTFSIADIVSNLDAVVVVGGGDSVSAVKKAGIEDKISHISTGGGASLEYIEFGQLPGIEILKV